MLSATDTPDGPLWGGTANQGRVVRVGDTVHRPRGSHTPGVHALLTHLAAVGFTRAPRVLTADLTTDPVVPGGRATEVLSFLEGEAATEPLAAWALTTEAVAGVGALLADYHRHVRTFDGNAFRWQRPVPAPWQGRLVTHNDVNPANVIFLDGRVSALIDFDLAAPATPAWELAVAACFWTPLRNAADVADARAGHGDERLRALLDGYGAPAALRQEVIAASVAANDWIAAIIADASRRGHPAFGRVWASQSRMYARADEWLRRNQGHLVDAVR